MTKLEVGKKYWIKAGFLGELSGRACGPDIPEKRYAFRIGELKTPTCIDFSVEDFESLEASPERDKVKIDRHMDVYITAAKENGLTLQKGLSDFKPKNSEIFARAWLDGYEVEKEPLYWVRDKNGYSLLFRASSGVAKSGAISSERQREAMEAYTFTEKEIKDYDERYFAFAVPVEEEE